MIMMMTCRTNFVAIHSTTFSVRAIVDIRIGGRCIDETITGVAHFFSYDTQYQCFALFSVDTREYENFELLRSALW